MKLTARERDAILTEIDDHCDFYKDAASLHTARIVAATLEREWWQEMPDMGPDLRSYERLADAWAVMRGYVLELVEVVEEPEG